MVVFANSARPMTIPVEPRFDLSAISEVDRLNIGATFFDAVQRFYENPVNLKRYRKWLKTQNHTRESQKTEKSKS